MRVPSPAEAISNSAAYCFGARRSRRSHASWNAVSSHNVRASETYGSVRGRNSSSENSSSVSPEGFISAGSATRITSPGLHR